MGKECLLHQLGRFTKGISITTIYAAMADLSMPMAAHMLETGMELRGMARGFTLTQMGQRMTVVGLKTRSMGTAKNALKAIALTQAISVTEINMETASLSGTTVGDMKEHSKTTTSKA
jgi:hypothetical protein